MIQKKGIHFALLFLMLILFSGWIFSLDRRYLHLNDLGAIGMNVQVEVATFGGGCFWCTEAVFERLEGVLSVRPGFAGGSKPNPSYQEVCMGTTGHAEVIQISFDANRITYEALLEVFFSTHDPTTLNRQGNDVGTQYRSAIFYHSTTQRLLAKEYIAQLEREKVFDSPIVTQVVPLDTFYSAEDYHQDYYAKNSNQPYCRMVIAPKLEKFKKKFKSKLKPN